MSQIPAAMMPILAAMQAQSQGPQMQQAPTAGAPGQPAQGTPDPGSAGNVAANTNVGAFAQSGAGASTGIQGPQMPTQPYTAPVNLGAQISAALGNQFSAITSSLGSMGASMASLPGSIGASLMPHNQSFGSTMPSGPSAPIASPAAPGAIQKAVQPAPSYGSYAGQLAGGGGGGGGGQSGGGVGGGGGAGGMNQMVTGLGGGGGGGNSNQQAMAAPMNGPVSGGDGSYVPVDPNIQVSYGGNQPVDAWGNPINTAATGAAYA